jgi:hypothetical protein
MQRRTDQPRLVVVPDSGQVLCRTSVEDEEPPVTQFKPIPS